jgi:hypothetical protein
LGDQVKEDEMGRACSTHGRDEKCIQNYNGKLKGRDHSEDIVEDNIREIRSEDVNWSHLAQDRNQ